MNISLHDADKNNYPNLALMKLSAWHKAKGDNINWLKDATQQSDKIYSSKVFTFTVEDPELPQDVEKGGTGYELLNVLPDEIEHHCPDYNLYGLDYSMGFLTRGCHRRLACDHVGQMESVRKAVELLRWHNATPGRYFCYLLVRDVDDAVERVRFLKTIWVDPFAQPYLDKEGTKPTEEQRHFARWVNQKAEFKSRTWEDYRASKMKGN